ncbi:MAG TPA: TolC family protein [Polyangia bacterium]
MRGTIRAASLLACALASSAKAAEPSPASDLTIEKAVATALEKNLELKAAAAEVEAARGRGTSAAILLPNPQVEVEAGPRRRPDGTKITDVQLALSQPIPIAGQRGARVSAADAGLRAAQARFALRRIEVAAEVRIAFARATAGEQRLKLANDADHLAQEALRAAEERLRAGAASQIEVNTARGQRGRAARDLIIARQEHAASLGVLRLLLSAPSRTPLALQTASLGTAPAALVPADADPDALVSKAAATHPAIGAARADLDLARAEGTLAGRQVVPDLELGVVAGRDDEAKLLRGRLSVALPLFDRRQGERQIAAARVVQAERALESAERRLEQDLRVALVRRQAAAEAVEAYAGGVVEALTQNLSMAGEAYMAGKIDFLELLLIRRESLEARRAYIDTLEELQTADAALRNAMGAAP